MRKAMNRIRSAFGGTSLVRDERGLSTVEYVIILVLIAAAAIGLWVSFGGKIKDKLTDVNTEMDKVKIEKTQ